MRNHSLTCQGVFGNVLRERQPWGYCMSFLLGIDVGTSGTKALLIDVKKDGEVVASATKTYPLYTPRPLWAEQEPEDWWQAALATLDAQGLLAFKAQVRAALIAAGLFDAEADSLLRIWDSGFFNAEGLTAFYITPRSEYDRMLPLKILP